ncbi:hypothetical protein B0H10DRAFT_2208589 [Mycena sp. CBHHK59/15]|nr:hypothetical protein B0H10DRAFT_2208589 [Mycena sp. CBHHK59/15]
MGIYGNPYFTYLSLMRRQEDEPPPKRPTDFQFYMRHPEYKEGVADRFEDLYGDEPRSKHIALRCKVAREMLAEEPEDVRERVKVECDEAHAEEMAVYEEGGEGLPSVDPEVQQWARDNFMATVAPLLAGLRGYTGYTINVIAGRIVGNTFDVASANTGLTEGKDWAQWDPAAYTATLKLYANFVQAVHLETTGPTTASSGEVSAAPAPGPSTTVPATADDPMGANNSVFQGMNLLRISEP